ncbi:MAG: tyrosine-type recombinase/integrase [Candidatus Eisenbacteria bacterium]|nr:tyrosine-type recombinase/integrase [Candidatus Eisenbacteria bacterium]
MRASIECFLSDLLAGRGFSPRTAESYRRDLTAWMAFLIQREGGRLPKPGQLRHAHVTLYLADLSRHGRAARTLARHLSAIRSYARWLRRHGEEASFTAGLKGPKLPRPVPAFLTEAEMDRVFRLDFGEGIDGLRDRSIIEILYATGIRLAELVGLNRDDAIDLERGQVRVLGKGNRERIVPMGREAGRALEAYRVATATDGRADREGMPFFLGAGGRRLSRRTVQRIIARHLGRVASRSGLSPHLLRHTVATHLLARMSRDRIGRSASAALAPDIRAVQELLGHVSLSSTQVYTHVTVDRLRAAMQHAHPRGED